jgi:hypothetical protein
MNRSISTIARDIARDWTKPNFAAVPYLRAMQGLDAITDSYGADKAATVVSYFLGNAGQWRGDKARAIKAELKAMLAGKAPCR